MILLKKTAAGTIGAYRFDDNGHYGFGVGPVVKAPNEIAHVQGVVFLMEKDGVLQLVLKDEKLKEMDIQVVHE